MATAKKQTPKTAAQRKADERARRRKDGLVMATEWVPAAAREKLAQYAAKLRKAAGT